MTHDNEMLLIPSRKMRVVTFAICEVLSNKLGIPNLQDIRMATVDRNAIGEEFARKTTNCCRMLERKMPNEVGRFTGF